ncbi:conserved protein of unknown function [Candidatus Promineifilum breve]|uniref:Toxin-antitoxin system, toxin component, RelE family n=1 Tax=Candidatus Promineifilum breve TaxID=1806508 RepID=A0A160T7N3_9CHLR|nr:type II toxin-antitoxin system HigB family toxin [Candidatus Promineifilum breve]CUS04900.2 conserved protein of unknown function [Candidatus Promineifilum breve]
MRIIALRTLREFWQNHPDIEQSLKNWHATAKAANWTSPADVVTDYRSASIIANNRIVFNIHGNRYRLITAVDYRRGIVYIRFIGTHRDYDKIDARTI